MHLVSLGTDSTYAYLPEHKWEKLVDQASVRKELAVANAIGTVFSKFFNGIQDLILVLVVSSINEPSSPRRKSAFGRSFGT